MPRVDDSVCTHHDSAMPHPEYRIEPTTELVLLFDHGFLDFEAWERSVRGALQEAPRLGRLRLLSDRRGLTHPHSLGLVEQILAFLREQAQALGHAQWALVGQPGTSVQEILELGEELAPPTGIQLKAFTDPGSAIRWLLPIRDEAELRRLVQWVEARGDLTA